MSFVACGLSHKTAPIDIRERFYFPKEKIAASLKDFKKNVLVNDAVILSTCNRTEIYCSSVKNPHVISDWLAHHQELTSADLAPHLYVYQGEESIKHVFRVASGIDSMVLGEPQIFGQLKEAVSIAEDTGTLNGTLRKFFHHAFSVGKKIRTETDIGVNPVSLGQVIFHLARKKIKDLSHARVLLIGAGETIESIAHVLQSHHVKDICIANRTLSKAHKIADTLPGARVCTLSEIDLSNTDLVISAAHCIKPIITKNATIQQPILFFDLGVPRNIAPEIKKNKNTTLFSFDDLKEILDQNRDKRLSSVSAAESMIDAQTKQFMLNLRSCSVADAVKRYRHKMNDIRDDYLEKALQSLVLGENPEKVLEKFAHQLTNKFLHAPSVNLKKAACQEDWILVHAVEKLWDI
ncbi:MAG TPA: glutamyl-tRNA reductase [Gammaproteobacteria bacterium]|nr:glutamyl-tRNA reductase [Gammaproteobacteria bacterium]